MHAPRQLLHALEIEAVDGEVEVWPRVPHLEQAVLPVVQYGGGALAGAPALQHEARDVGGAAVQHHLDVERLAREALQRHAHALRHLRRRPLHRLLAPQLRAAPRLSTAQRYYAPRSTHTQLASAECRHRQ